MKRTDISTRDPVCGMKTKETLRWDHKGETFYFCSNHCQKVFLRDPEFYLKQREYYGSALGPKDRGIAYFSMEIGIDPRIPSYSGGLGILAGDMIRSCADMKVPMMAVTLLARKGYFSQKLDEQGNQREMPVVWSPEDILKLLHHTVRVQIEDRTVAIRAWQYDVIGSTGYSVPVIFLDTELKENNEADRSLSGSLYGGDERYRFAQEVVLGIGGIRMINRLGYRGIEKYHLNEGHSSLLVLELLRKWSPVESAQWDYQAVRDACVFTTHTPLPAGHDQFTYELVETVLGRLVPLDILKMLAGPESLNMTALALNMSTYINGVARKHGEISRMMFPGYSIDSITNGVHAFTWTCEGFQELYDRYISGWANDPYSLRYALNIPKPELWKAHEKAKERLIAHVGECTKGTLDKEAFTIGFARRATLYKRADLVFSDIERLREISSTVGRLQFVFAGKAHPKDWEGKELIKKIVSIAKQLKPEIKVFYLENYDIELGKLLTSGVDLWLNTPRIPHEASGTSGMKAALNGVPSLSVLDGWWVEGHIEGITGWSIGTTSGHAEEGTGEAQELYDKLKYIILPMFYNQREKWIDVMQHCIAINGSFFNTHRMVQQYVLNSYLS